MYPEEFRIKLEESGLMTRGRTKKNFFRQATVVLIRLSITILPDHKASVAETANSEALRRLELLLIQIVVRGQGQNTETFGGNVYLALAEVSAGLQHPSLVDRDTISLGSL